jgi:hypothetical protein
MKNLNRKTETDRLRRNEQKWSPTLMEAGWTVLPSIILERQKALGLDAIDVNILLHLARYWWFSDNPPRPSKRTIAECMKIDVSTVRRRIARMERDGLIRREHRFSGKTGRQETNNYHFDGLIKASTPYAKEKIAVLKQREKEDAERRNRKRAILKLVPDPEEE